MATKNYRLIGMVITVVILSFVPFIAMQFTNDVHWSLFDFVIAGILLFTTIFAIEFVIRKTTKSTKQLFLILAILALVVLVWLELAVGIFGTPIAGS